MGAIPQNQPALWHWKTLGAEKLSLEAKEAKTHVFSSISAQAIGKLIEENGEAFTFPA